MSFREQFRAHAFVHLGWTIAALVATIILLISVKVGTNDALKDIINTALTLTSLVLAVLAIVQALISGGALNDIVSNLRSEIDEIKEPAKSLEVAASLLTDKSTQIGESAKRFTDYLSSVSSSRVVTSAEIQGNSKEKADIEEILNKGSNGVKAALYCSVYVYERRVGLSSKKVFSRQSLAGFVDGFLATMRTLNLMDISYTNSEYHIKDLKDFAWIIENRDLLVRGERMQPYKSEVDKYFEDLQI